MRFSIPVAVVLFVASLLVVDATMAQSQLLDAAAVVVDKKTNETSTGSVTSGKFRVFENRETNSGRMINLDFVVLHATGDDPKPDPFFFFVGGPGQAATSLSGQLTNHWIRKDRDLVLISQRGTGGDNRLAFDYETDGNTLQQYLGPVMDETTVKKNLERLQKQFDLRMYSTFAAMDDVNDFRKAMGYEKINITGGSYGTRACLVYMLRHGDTVRTATLAGCAPIEFRNPLYHAEGAQRALDMIFDEIESNEEYRKAFGDLRKKFAEITKRLEEKPVTVEIINRSNGKPEPVTMDRDTFLASVRFQMYYTGGSRALPRLLIEAHQGNFRPFVLSALKQNVALRRSLAMGMLLSVTSAEDVARIDPNEVEKLTGDSFFGSGRVDRQRVAAALWPKSQLPSNFDKPVQSDVPTLILSGTLDPVTPPKWGEMVHKNFPNSVHVVVPTAHDIGGTCIDRIKRQFLESGSVDGLELDCAKKMKLPPLQRPGV